MLKVIEMTGTICVPEETPPDVILLPLSLCHVYCWVCWRKRHRCRRAADFDDQCPHIVHGANCHKIRCGRSVSNVSIKKVWVSYHWIIKPSPSALLQTHLVLPLLELEGVAPSGSVTVVGDVVEEP